MRKDPTAGIILAAGESTRFGACKQMLRLQGRMLCEWVLDAAFGSRLDRLVLVTGRDHDPLVRALGPKIVHPRLEVIFNPDYRGGMSTSLRAGLLRVQEDSPSAMFLLADQPLVNPASLDLIIERFQRSSGAICVPVFEGRRGNPAIFSRSLYPELIQISGDEGGRSLISAHLDQVLAVQIDDPSFFWDIDTPADFEKLRALLESPRPI